MDRSKRIEYIDAMRGFTMILVVMSHVSIYCLQVSNQFVSINAICREFRMPLFFFVAGFVFYKKNKFNKFKDILQFVENKLLVQIISPFLFFIAFIYVFNFSFNQMLFDSAKGGYWFTFSLFEYFLLYIMLDRVVKMAHAERYEDIIIIIIAGYVYLNTVYSCVVKYGLNGGIFGLLSVPHLHYFIFFCIGTIAKKYFVNFECLLDNKYVITLATIVFFLLNIVPKLVGINSTLYDFVLSSTGILIVFNIFRNSKIFFSSTKYGEILQFIGRRTLDIYLIHYFVIQTCKHPLLPQIVSKAPFFDFLLSSLMAFCIIAVCLLVSYILRQSEILSHYLFGKKYNN